MCTARAVTTGTGDNVLVIKVGAHQHPPDRDGCLAAEVMHNLKRKAEENPSQAPALLIRSELQNVSEPILAQLPERRNLKKAIRRARRVELSPSGT